MSDRQEETEIIKTPIEGEKEGDAYVATPDLKQNGYYFRYAGEFLDNVTGGDSGNADDIYVCDKKNRVSFLNARKLNSTYTRLKINAATIYGESSTVFGIVEKSEFFAIASVHKKNNKAYGAKSDSAREFLRLSENDRNTKTAMKYAIAAEINALLDGQDYSNGAKQWDGAEQAYVPSDTPDIGSNGTWMFKINVMGWDISDEHYNSWKNAIVKKFGISKFNVPQKKYAVENYAGMFNKDKIRLKSSAQYGLSIFWKEVSINKPRE